MTKVSNTQSQKRFEESLASLFNTSSVTHSRDVLFLKSSSDEGVIRNGGRNGARLAPQSLLATFKKFNRTKTLNETCFMDIEVADREQEQKDFALAQKHQAERISQAIATSKSPWICHIGGGHDHIYPLLKAVSDKSKKVIVINIDAHADTRTDDAPHSGTPFRQFANEFAGKFELFQVGLHPFANSFSTLSPLERQEMKILWKSEIESGLGSFMDQIKNSVDEQTTVIFSLDADALSVAQVPGVSAVNADGISLESLFKIWQGYVSLGFTHSPIMGIYELNPVYDSLAAVSMRSLSTFIFQTLN